MSDIRSEDTIKRSDAIKALRKLGHEVVVIDKVCSLGVAQEFIDAIRKLPSADRPQGEWVNQHKWSNGFFERECSVCGAMKPLLRHTAKINFCPNCGADMRKGAE